MILGKENMYCLFCYGEHEVSLCQDTACKFFNGKKVDYPSRYFCCSNCGAVWVSEDLKMDNDRALIAAYQRIWQPYRKNKNTIGDNTI